MLDRPRIPTDPVLLGHVTSTFYGGRAECHIRNTPVPVSVRDFTSMYPTVDILMGLWDLLTVDRVGVVDCTKDLCRFVDTLAVEDCLNPDLWPSFVGVVQIEPDGDILPVRADYSGQPGTYNVGANPLFSPRPLWFTIPDIVASTLLTGRPPMIRRALRFTPAGGKLPTLNGTALSGAVHVNPAIHDFFRTVVERRADLKVETKDHPDTCPCERCRTHRFLKVLANSGSYGIFVEMLREETGRQSATVWGAWDDPWTTTVTGRETVREFCYPPIGTIITGAARLMLALVERLVTDAGGSWAFCDTDSMAIVASKDGGLVPCQGGAERTADGQPAVRALSSAQVDDIRDTLNQLNPYDRSKVRDLLKREHDCWAYAISAKRYALFGYDPSGSPQVIL